MEIAGATLVEVFQRETPMIITLCGSARFEAWFHIWNEALSLSGHVVLGLSSYPSLHGGKKDWYTPEEKVVLDEVHKRKISASRAVVFLNVMAYMGESTLSEFRYARDAEKKIVFLESWGEDCAIGESSSLYVREALKRFGLKGGSPIDTSVYPCVALWDLLPPSGAFRSRIVERLEKRIDRAMGKP
jgi:hypothetical protein